MEGVLEGTRVLDLSRYLAGPFCATVLADMGAEVIRIETPGGAEDRNQGPATPAGDNFRYLMLNRNKKGITLDLDQPEGKRLFRELLAKSDIVVENFSPPVKEKLGLTYEALKQLKPEVILVTISAFGTDGPYSHRLGFDQIVQAESGAMSFTGFPDGDPVRTHVSWVDLSTGLYAALGASLALIHRNKTGEGQWVEMALMDTGVSFVAMAGTASEYQVLGQMRPRLGNAGYYHFCDTLAARDGMVMIVTLSDPLWRRLARLIGRPDLIEDPRFVDDTSRYTNQHLIRPIVQEWVGQRTVNEVLEAMGQARIPSGRVNNIAEMVADPQVVARRMFKELEVPGAGMVIHPRLAMLLSKTPGEIEQRAPQVGEHNELIYQGLLGLSAGKLAELAAAKII